MIAVFMLEPTIYLHLVWEAYVCVHATQSVTIHTVVLALCLG